MAESTTSRDQKRRLGGWLPNEEPKLVRFRRQLAEQANAHAKANARHASIGTQSGTREFAAPLNSVVQELATLIHEDAVLRMDLTRAIRDAHDAGYELGYASIDELMLLVDYLMTYAPPFSEESLIHCPLNALLDWPMCMPSGYALFRDLALNAQLKRVLTVWCGFLSGPHSRAHLNTSSPDGWFCAEADRQIGMDQFVCDPDKPYWGFASWNSFFTRHFKDGARPVAAPDDFKIIVSACEASPYNLQHDVKLHDRFWIKSQPYSLQDIFTPREPELARRFVGGSVYQAFLSAFNYHRWHAPVNGTIANAYHVDGAYFSEADSEGVDPSGLNDSQGYISAIATRAVIVIDCDDPALGQVACVFVGMADVSSCVIDALPGQHVAKGDELGYFQYGGSTYCLIFEPDVIRDFVPQPPFDDKAPPVKVNAHVATAR